MFDLEAIYRAASVQDAIAALVADPEAVVIAGGTDVLIRIREGKLAGCRLVSIHDLPELAGCRLDAAGALHIGPLTCFRDIVDHPLVQRHIPILAQAAAAAKASSPGRGTLEPWVSKVREKPSRSLRSKGTSLRGGTTTQPIRSRARVSPSGPWTETTPVL